MSDQKAEASGNSTRVAGWISLVIGLSGAAASIYVYYASQDRPVIAIEEFEPITYVTTKPLVGVGKVELTVNGQSVHQLDALPFSVKNDGNIPISSIENSGFYNLVSPIILEISLPMRDTYDAGIISAQVANASLNTLTIRPVGKGDVTSFEIDVRYLNPGETANFSVLYTGDQDPSSKIIGNPIIGGKIFMTKGAKTISKSTIWGKIKSVWLAQIIGVLFLAQVLIVSIFLLVGARNLSIEIKQNNERRSNFDNPERARAEREQKENIDAAVVRKLENIDGSVLSVMKDVKLEVPMGLFEETTAHRSIYDIFLDSFKSAWQYKLKDEFPIPADIENSWNKGFESRVVTPWIGWGHFFETAVILGAPSVIFGVIGYFLLFF